ncbi:MULTISPECIES: hypothetical protein [Laceyella]|uniref:hypothetical protein n=1 Tax=Laceyella TaxID=292635 RepID=UPI0012B9CFC4|nr:hypothetical protein [Laceyella sediminis]MRG28333.1 hypothetical protein [Laceyella tengchongensis]
MLKNKNDREEVTIHDSQIALWRAAPSLILRHETKNGRSNKQDDSSSLVFFKNKNN